MTLYHVDSFTKEHFKGNPAGVCILQDKDIDDALKMNIAGELKHSETAFVLIKNGEMTLRWFTPLKEVNLCGHATLAAAHILWEKGIIQNGSISFMTKSGEISVTKQNGLIEMDFPQFVVTPCGHNDIINEAFGINPVFTGKSSKIFLIEIAEPDLLRNMKPDFGLLNQCDPGEFLITCRSDKPEYDFLSRFFAPIIGIPEDPVTGFAHCFLAPYWGNKLNKSRMVGFQESKRTGIVECEISDNNRVKLRGNAVTFTESKVMNFNINDLFHALNSQENPNDR
jgi:PhzF family phenazine biosynthesis protein